MVKNLVIWVNENIDEKNALSKHFDQVTRGAANNVRNCTQQVECIEVFSAMDAEKAFILDHLWCIRTVSGIRNSFIATTGCHTYMAFAATRYTMKHRQTNDPKVKVYLLQSARYVSH